MGPSSAPASSLLSPAAASAFAAATASDTATRSSSTRSCSAAAAFSRLPKWPSIQVFVNSFGTARTSLSASCSTGVAAPNQLAKVLALRDSRRRCEIVSQVWDAAGSEVIERRVYAVAGRAARRYGGPRNPRNTAFCRDFEDAHRTLHTCGKIRGGRFQVPESGRLRGVCPWSRSREVDRLSTERTFAAAGGGPIRGAALYSRALHEAHLSAEHPQAREDARIPQAHEHPRRAGRAQA